MKKSVAALVLTAAALLAPAGVASAAPVSAAPVAETGSAAAEALCRLMKMLQAGYVDSSGSVPSCLASSGSA